MEYITETVTLVTLTCGKCQILFAMPRTKYDLCQNTGENFYCPNGHSRIFCESEVQKLQKQLDRAHNDATYWRQRKIDLEREAERTKRQLASQKGQTTKLKKRIGNGVCPCCNRHFANVARHIKGQHPEFTE